VDAHVWDKHATFLVRTNYAASGAAITRKESEKKQVLKTHISLKINFDRM
jgi:hypothetical protein